MFRNKILKKLSVVFTFLSISIWMARVYINQDPKLKDEELPTTEDQNGVDFDQADDKRISGWFHDKIHSLSPTPSVTSSSCPSVNVSSSHFSLMSGAPQEETGGADYVGTLSAIGELRLHLSGKEDELAREKEVSLWLQNVTEFVEDADLVLTSFSTSIKKTELEKAHQVLSGLKVLGTQIIASVANTIFHEEEATVTVRALERAGVEWVGVYAKKHHVVVVGKERVGFLAYCGVHRECGGSNTNLPFSPVKYTSKVAKSAVNNLKEHGVTLIVVMMYWGLETSYFPDESSLTIARHLAALGVGLVLGYHPNLIQDHAYFGNTLVIFSLGKIISSDRVSNYCWNKVGGEWKYSSTKICAMVHPKSRERLLYKEQQTRIYRIHLSKTHPAAAEYVSIRLDSDSANGYSVRRPSPGGRSRWTSVCSNSDNHCLACQQF